MMFISHLMSTKNAKHTEKITWKYIVEICMKYVPQFYIHYTKTRHSIFGSDSMTAERLHEDCIKIEWRLSKEMPQIDTQMNILNSWPPVEATNY